MAAPIHVTISAADISASIFAPVAHSADEVVHVAEVLGTVARTLASNDGLQPTLEEIVRLAVDTLAACEFAGIFLVEKRKITSPASSNDLPRRLDEIQSETGEGPCIDAIREHELFQTGDLRNESRWPRFSTRASEETGVCSILALRLFVEEDTLGALNLYSTKGEAFDNTDVALGKAFAANAAVAVLAARREEQLEQKAQTRSLIGQAMGIIMARSGVSADEAFEMLRAASQRTNEKLVDVAQRIVEQRPPEQPPQ